LHDAQNCLALRSFNHFLPQFSSFDNVFRHVHYQNSILVQNKHDIRNQHKKLHRIAYILTKYFFHQNLTRGGPQGKIQIKNGRGGVQVEF
jgi:hypothetical protein